MLFYFFDELTIWIVESVLLRHVVTSVIVQDFMVVLILFYAFICFFSFSSTQIADLAVVNKYVSHRDSVHTSMLLSRTSFKLKLLREHKAGLQQVN